LLTRYFSLGDLELALGRGPWARSGAAPPRPKFTGWFRIPAEYQNLAKPQLSYTIKSGQNSIDIELK